MSALSAILFADGQSIEGKFFENSFTERAQEAFFLCAIFLNLMLSRHNPALVPLALMFAGFFALCFVRELDALLKQKIGTGTWQLLVTSILISMIYHASIYWTQLMQGLGAHAETYSLGLFVAGFITTFAFSRIIGNESLWKAIMGEVYQRNVKNAVEVGIELLEDALLLLNTIEFYIRGMRVGTSQQRR